MSLKRDLYYTMHDRYHLPPVAEPMVARTLSFFRAGFSLRPVELSVDPTAPTGFQGWSLWLSAFHLVIGSWSCALALVSDLLAQALPQASCHGRSMEVLHFGWEVLGMTCYFRVSMRVGNGHGVTSVPSGDHAKLHAMCRICFWDKIRLRPVDSNCRQINGTSTAASWNCG